MKVIMFSFGMNCFREVSIQLYGYFGGCIDCCAVELNCNIVRGVVILPSLTDMLDLIKY